MPKELNPGDKVRCIRGPQVDESWRIPMIPNLPEPGSDYTIRDIMEWTYQQPTGELRVGLGARLVEISNPVERWLTREGKYLYTREIAFPIIWFVPLNRWNSTLEAFLHERNNA